MADVDNPKFQIELAMSSSRKDAAVAAAAPSEAEDSEITEIEDNCYLALLEKVKEVALERKVNSNSIMSTEVSSSPPFCKFNLFVGWQTFQHLFTLKLLVYCRRGGDSFITYVL